MAGEGGGVVLGEIRAEVARLAAAVERMEAATSPDGPIWACLDDLTARLDLVDARLALRARRCRRPRRPKWCTAAELERNRGER